MSERCPTCGAAVRVVSSDEGTHHYAPLTDGAVPSMLDSRERNLLDELTKNAEARGDEAAATHFQAERESREAYYSAYARLSAAKARPLR